VRASSEYYGNGECLNRKPGYLEKMWKAVADLERGAFGTCTFFVYP
jgi:hypothetical protein